MVKLPIALQVYSVREEAAADFNSTMQKIKDLGYDGIELAGLYGLKPEYIRDCLNNIGLNPISAHVPYSELKNNLQETVEAYAVIGCKYIAIPYLAESERYGGAAYEDMLAFIPTLAEECKKHDIILMYHNHDFEFQKTEEGEYILDALYRECSEDILQTEIDTCWVKVAGVDPISYIKQYKGRVPIVHLKDYTGSEPLELTAVGHGIQDIEGILNICLEAGTKWVVVEQDEHTVNTPMEDTKLSIEYLRKMNW